jgi:hypothetical protein
MVINQILRSLSFFSNFKNVSLTRQKWSPAGHTIASAIGKAFE